ncbi:MAG: HEAT repeat domain-containing protein, partial [Candidatus Omnitrophota bacterium]
MILFRNARIKSLIEKLKQSKTRQNAALKLAAIGEPAVLALVEVLGDKDYWVGEAASEALVKIAKPEWINKPLSESNKTAIFALAKALKSKNIRVRRWAAHTLREIEYHVEDVAVPLVEALKDEDKFVRKDAIEALGHIISKDAIFAVPALGEALKIEDDKDVLEAIVRVLGKISFEKEDATPILIEALSLTKDSEVLHSAIVAMGVVEVGRYAEIALLELSKLEAVLNELIESSESQRSRYWYVHSAAKEAIEKIRVEQLKKPKAEDLRTRFNSFINRLTKEDPELTKESNIEKATALFEEAFKHSEGFGLRRSQKYAAKIMHKEGKFVLMEVGGGKTYVISLTSLLRVILAKVNGKDTQPYIMTTSDYLALEAAGVTQGVFGQLGLKVCVLQMDGKMAGSYDSKTGDFKFSDRLPDVASAWRKADVIIGTKSSFFFPVEQGLFALYKYQQAVLERQKDLLIDENDRIMVQEISESHMISSGRVRADAKEIDYIQRFTNKIAKKWYDSKDSRFFVKVKGAKTVKLLNEGEKELEKCIKDELKDKSYWEKISVKLKYKYFLKIALEAYECRHLNEAGDYVFNENKTDIVITDEASGEAKPGSEWTDLHNAIRIKHGFETKPARHTLISMPFPAMVPGKGQESPIKTTDGRPLIGKVIGATGTDASRAMKEIYGFETAKVPSEAVAERIIEHIAEGKGIIMHAKTLEEARAKLKTIRNTIRDILEDYKEDELWQRFGKKEGIEPQELLAKIKEIVQDKTDSDIIKKVSKDGEAKPAVENISEDRTFNIVVTAEDATIKRLRENIATKAVEKVLALIGRITFVNYIYRANRSKNEAGNQKIKELYDEKNKSVIARVESIEKAKEKGNELIKLGIEGENITIISAKNMKTARDVDMRLNPVLNDTGKVAIVAGNIINRGVNTRMNELLQTNGAWLTGINFYFDKYAAEAIQLEGRFGRAGDAGEWLNYLSVEDVRQMAPEGAGRSILDRLLNGEMSEPLPEKETMELFDEIRKMNEQKSIEQAREENKFLEFRYRPHKDLTLVDNEGTKREVSIWEMFFTIKNNIAEGRLLKRYLEIPADDPSRPGKTWNDVLNEKANAVVKAVEVADGKETKRKVLAEAIKKEFRISFRIDSKKEEEKKAAQAQLDVLLKKINEIGLDGIKNYIIGFLSYESLQQAHMRWEEFFTVGLEDTKKMLSQTDWANQASGADTFTRYAGIPVNEFNKTRKEIAKDIRDLLVQKLAEDVPVAEEKKPAEKLTRAPEKRILSLDTVLRKGIIPGIFGVISVAAVALAFMHVLVPWVATAMVMTSLVSVVGFWKADLKLTVFGLISSAGVFAIFKGIMGFLNIQGLLGTASSGFLAPVATFILGHPIAIALLAFVLVSSLILSNAFSQHLQKIQKEDKGKQDLAMSLAGHKVGGEVRKLSKPIFQQLLSITNNILPLFATTAAAVMAASGILSFIGLPMTGAFAMYILIISTGLAFLGLISRSITIFTNRSLLKETEDKALDLKPFQQFSSSLLRAFTVLVSTALMLQITGIPFAMLALPALGILASIIFANRFIHSAVKKGLVDKRAERLGELLSIPAFLGLMPIVFLAGGLATHLWAIGLISALLFGASGVINIIAIRRDIEHYVGSQVSAREAYRNAFGYFFRQYIVLNIIAVVQSLTGLIGIPLALWAGVKTVGLGVVVLFVGNGFLYVAALMGVAWLSYRIYEGTRFKLTESKINRRIKGNEAESLLKFLRGISNDFNKKSIKEQKLADIFAIIRQEAARARDKGAQMKIKEAQLNIIEEIIDSLEREHSPPAGLRRKYLPRDIRILIDEKLSGIPNLSGKNKKLLKEIIYHELFRKLNLIVTPIDTLDSFRKEREKLMQAAGFVMSLSMIVPSGSTVAIMQEHFKTEAQKRLSLATNMFMPTGVTAGFDAAAQNILDILTTAEPLKHKTLTAQARIQKIRQVLKEERAIRTKEKTGEEGGVPPPTAKTARVPATKPVLIPKAKKEKKYVFADYVAKIIDRIIDKSGCFISVIEDTSLTDSTIATSIPEFHNALAPVRDEFALIYGIATVDQNLDNPIYVDLINGILGYINSTPDYEITDFVTELEKMAELHAGLDTNSLRDEFALITGIAIADQNPAVNESYRFELAGIIAYINSTPGYEIADFLAELEDVVSLHNALDNLRDEFKRTYGIEVTDQVLTNKAYRETLMGIVSYINETPGYEISVFLTGLGGVVGLHDVLNINNLKDEFETIHGIPVANQVLTNTNYKQTLTGIVSYINETPGYEIADFLAELEDVVSLHNA